MGKSIQAIVGNHFEKFINDEIVSGRYNSPDEVIRSALRLLETEGKKMKLLRKELELGEKSPMIEDFEAEKQLAMLHEKYL